VKKRVLVKEVSSSRMDWINEKIFEDRFDKIYEVLVRMEERLKVIEESVKNDKPKKQLLND
jgi:Mg2+ and Co2+ transporter CorA